MAGRAKTREFYGKLVQGYRESPGNHAATGRWVGCDWRTAQRAWEHGWPRYPWARPIRDVLREEEESARKRAAALEQELAEREREHSDKAREDYIEARAQEQQMLKVARHDVMASLAACAKLAPAVGLIADHIAAQVQRGLGQLPTDKALRLISAYVKVTKQASDAAETVVKLSRLERGAATELHGLGVVEEELSLEDALHELERAGELKQLLEARAPAAVIDAAQG